MSWNKRYYYLIHIQYLGFRFHGWHKQPAVKTVQGMIEKTLFYVLGHDTFKTLGASRTDAGVSVMEGAFELFTREPIEQQELLEGLNRNLPNDIRALRIKEVDEHFNIIQSPKAKEYHYVFSFGEKIHPFCAPFMVYMQEHLDVERMKQGARLFEGWHNFYCYCKKPGPDAQLEREITYSRLEENTIYQAGFFPDKSYVYVVRGSGFMRNQIRLMMGALFALGRGEISLEEIRDSLKGERKELFSHAAPPSGLILHKIVFE